MINPLRAAFCLTAATGIHYRRAAAFYTTVGLGTGALRFSKASDIRAMTTTTTTTTAAAGHDGGGPHAQECVYEDGKPYILTVSRRQAVSQSVRQSVPCAKACVCASCPRSTSPPPPLFESPTIRARPPRRTG
jgi:hypothetical protein